jgi:hypothetical protein
MRIEKHGWKSWAMFAVVSIGSCMRCQQSLSSTGGNGRRESFEKGMRQLNGVYTQRFNRRHGMVEHLYQGRYKTILVQKESCLLELIRYSVLNPLRAGMVGKPED